MYVLVFTMISDLISHSPLVNQVHYNVCERRNCKTELYTETK